jgi:two-component system, OmpR family, sensor kinase
MNISLRARLTIIYAALMGAILLLFGVAAYAMMNIVLLSQVDNLLADVSADFVSHAAVGPLEKIEITSAPSNQNVDVSVQVWGIDDKLQTGFGSLGQNRQAFDKFHKRTTQAIYQETTVNSIHLRVLSFPLKHNGRNIAVMQIASRLDTVEVAREYLIAVMVVIWVYGVITAGVASSFTVGRALEPLKSIVETAEHINRADDLSRRIPSQGTEEDEIGSLIKTFNQTLEKLELLFTSQQRFLADVSHELRTPLTVIKGNVDLMRRMKQFDEESLTGIDQEAGRLTRLVGGLLMLAQAESGKLPLNLRPVELDMLVTEVFQEMHVLAGGKVHVHLNDIDQLVVNGDRDRLKQVLINLVANAIQYTPQEGDVFISLTKIGDQARIICRDTGPGIPAEDLPHIFERFYRAEKSRTRSRTTGFGLGLSITKWIVEHHGGHIEVISKEGEGTTFAIWLPLWTVMNLKP